MFSADAGLSKVDINNLAVIGNIVVFACIGWLEVAESRFGLQRIGIASIGFIGLVFLLFSFNTTLVWSVAVVAVLGVLVKASNVWRGLWLGLADREGVPAGPATGTMFAVRSLTLVAQPFVMAALVGANHSNAAVVLGLFCAACAIVLWRFGNKVR